MTWRTLEDSRPSWEEVIANATDTHSQSEQDRCVAHGHTSHGDDAPRNDDSPRRNARDNWPQNDQPPHDEPHNHTAHRIALRRDQPASNVRPNQY